jgi:hypothetical protein
MTQNQLKILFNKNYQDIFVYTSKALTKHKNVVDASALLSECYLYLDDKRHDIDDESILVSWAKTFIKNNLNWSYSTVKKRENGKRQLVLVESYYDANLVQCSNDPTYEEIMEVLNDFKETLNTVDKRIFDMYTIRGIQKGKDMALHLGISISGAYGIIIRAKQLEEKFRKQYEQFKKS